VIYLIHTVFRDFNLVPSSVTACQVKVKDKIILRIAVYRQSVRLGAHPFEDHDQRFLSLQVNPCSRSPYITSSLTRGWVCLCQVYVSHIRVQHVINILPCALYRVSHEERSIFCEVIVSVILSKKKCICTCVLLRSVSGIELFHCTVQTSNTPYPHTSCKVHWCWQWNFRKCIILGKLHQLCHLNNKYWYYK
jgi:hypothetical protein